MREERQSPWLPRQVLLSHAGPLLPWGQQISTRMYELLEELIDESSSKWSYC
ncbi:unnamed protein product [Prunus armeniaca]|uniref:Uncharacterized protein n=1 Tax=Prunus armeniaca TaxID=36596 RepID=A0A6J5TM52_PRUAR|nr:unnamed protein product [Prunus armeniaca]CAB4294672.1 unnamed protein product [Prunus armeniaca]